MPSHHCFIVWVPIHALFALLRYTSLSYGNVFNMRCDCMELILNLFVFSSFAPPQGLGNGRQLMESCSLSCRIFDYEDGTEFIEPFCVLQGADRNPNKGGRNNVRITGGNGVAASKNLINAAAAGDSDFFADAYIDEESGDLVVADDADVEVSFMFAKFTTPC